MSEVVRQIHITKARKRMFDKIFTEGGPFLSRELHYSVLDGVKSEFHRREDGSEVILVNQPLSEEKEAMLREIWELTMPPAPIADKMRRERCL